MESNKFALKNLMDERFNSSYTKLSRAIGVDVAHVYRVLAKNNTPGIKFFNGIIKWCTDNQLDYREYIFLPKPLTVVNKTAKVQ
ncbi:XRE family transcriptional regulator [Clostridium estertheticum]|uniref:XRE family transcriptional regulator n=1 Tax=Clostridium estertheticum TaxID=238834 RepID=A0A7Y3SZN2_9CLOT|nr:XRE family transcriptional regulator [Clostridium estertheticum]NNU78336.1 XRE family transcriptional regulator [Clostridium estertheticum]WBL45309.1 hypothetical protein LOR37_11405 [Clostridium estertheticum]